MMIEQPSKASTESLNMHCALLGDTLEICKRGNDFAELPEELQGNIRHLLEYVATVTIKFCC